VAGETAEQQFRSVPRHPAVTISLIGLAPARVPILARTIRLQLRWVDPLRRRALSRIINLPILPQHHRSLCGLCFANHMEIGLLISLAVAFAFQTVFFQIAVRAKNGTLVRWRAAVLSLIVILGDFLVAWPLIELWERLRA
jgi:hypothetical protein